MGNVNAAAMAEAVGEGQVALRPALAWHLQSNHYPPVPVSMVDPCLAAIAALVDEEPSLEIELPEGVTYKGQTTAPAVTIADQHHLWFFVEAEATAGDTYEFGDEEYE
jgi:hypothetical protein